MVGGQSYFTIIGVGFNRAIRRFRPSTDIDMFPAVAFNGASFPPRQSPSPFRIFHPPGPIPMRICKLSSIIIKPNRQRQEFSEEAIEELRESIESLGLMHPPVLREEEEGLVLVAGERRLRAISDSFALGVDLVHDGQTFTAEAEEIPYTSLGDLTELEAEEAELDENLKRKDLSWQELAAAHSRLHRLRINQNQAKLTDALEADDGSFEKMDIGHTIADTAQELYGRSDGDYQDKLRKELIVAQHLDNPLIAGAKTAKDAFKILKAQEERTKNVALALEVGKTFSVDSHHLYNVNSLDWMRNHILRANNQYSPPVEQFDVICTDPPYGMGADQFGDGGGKMLAIEHHYDDSPESWRILMQQWCPLSFEVCKPQAHAYVFCDFDRYHELKAMMEAAGWEVFRTPLIVHKRNSGRVPLPDRGPRRQYELVLFANKGRMPCTAIYPDVISVEADENTGHGAQKPVALYQNLLQRSVRPGMQVADFFGGSGPMLPAAHLLKCYATICEQSPEYYAKIVKRAQDLRALENGELF